MGGEKKFCNRLVLHTLLHNNVLQNRDDQINCLCVCAGIIVYNYVRSFVRVQIGAINVTNSQCAFFCMHACMHTQNWYYCCHCDVV